MIPKSTISNSFVAAIAAISPFFCARSMPEKEKTVPMEVESGAASCITEPVM